MSSSLGRYNIIRKIGSGGMAEVFLAESEGAQGIRKILVVKKIHPAMVSNRRFLDMFIDEARVAMRLNHSNIVQVYAFDQIDDDHLLAMEYVDGADLLKLRHISEEKGERIPFGLSAFIAAEIAKGLDYAHSKKGDYGEPLDIVHRDVSPQNVLVSRDGAVKVADFGIAKARSVHEESTGEVKGKAGYMPPEQAKGLSVDRRADIYALGVVLHEMLCAQNLVTIEKGENPLLKASFANHPGPKEIDSTVPAELDAIVRRAISLKVEDRYMTARLFARDLGVYLHGLDEIFDAQNLETWLEGMLPEAQAIDMASPETIIRESEQTTRIATINMSVLGETEQRSVVLISVRFAIAEHPESESIGAEFNRLADEIAYKRQGIMREMTGGIRIFLGLPHSSLLDSINGLRVATDLRDVINALERDNQVQIKARFSVSRGEVEYRRAVGDEGLSFQPETSLIEVSMALMDAGTDGSIMASDGIFRLARQEYKFGSPVSIVSDSQEDGDVGSDVRGYPLGRGKTRKERGDVNNEIGAFVGRELEIGQLREMFRRSLQGQATIIKVTGELGIGKSRMVRTFLKHAEDAGARIVRAECLFVERDMPLGAVAEVVKAALCVGDGEPRLKDALGSLISGAPTYLARQVQFFEDTLHAPDVAWGRAGENRRLLVRRVAFGLGVILAASARSGGLVLVVENAHWADGPSVDTLSELAAASGKIPLMVLLVGKPSLLAERKIANLKTLEVKELPDVAMRQILEARLGDSGDMKAIVSQIYDRAQGNPFFAGEIVDSLIDRGILTPSEGNADIGEGTKFLLARSGIIRLPTTMEGIAASQVDTLDDSARTVLRTASAIGAAFDMETVAKIVGGPVREELRQLVELGFLMKTEGSDEVTYRFRKSMIREAAYGGLSRQDKHRIHGTLAAELITRFEAGEVVPAARIAWHLEKGGKSDSAGNYYIKGGNAAMLVNSNRRALRLYDRALSVIPGKTRRRYEALMLRENVLKDLGHHQQRRDTVDEMENIAKLLEDRSMQVSALIVRAQLCFDRGDLENAASAISFAIVLMDGVDDLSLSVKILRILAYVASEEGHLQDGLECCDHALALIQEGLDDEYFKARILGIKGFVLSIMGRLDVAPSNLAGALVLFRRLGKRRNQSVVMSNMALLARLRGNLQEGIEFLEQAILIDREIKNLNARGRKIVALGTIHVELGNFAEGQTLLEEGRRISRDNQESVGELEADMGLAELWLQLEDVQGAAEILSAIANDGLLSRSLVLQTKHQQLLFEIALKTNDVSGALEAAKEAAKIARTAGMSGEIVHGLARTAVALLNAGRQEQAVEAADQVAKLLEDSGGVRRSEELWSYRARVLNGAGIMEQAAEAIEKAAIEVERKAAMITNPQFLTYYKSHPLIKQILARKIC